METLILSAAFEPMQVVPWQKAVTLLFMNKVEIVEEYEDHRIRTVRMSLAMPSVVRFVKVLRNRKRAIKFSRQNVFARDKGRCQYCRERVPRHLATYDHVLPRGQGGTTRWENVVISCVDCNQRKGNRTPEGAKMRLANVPVKPKSLHGVEGMTITYQPGMPLSWSQFLVDARYWMGAIDQE